MKKVAWFFFVLLSGCSVNHSPSGLPHTAMTTGNPTPGQETHGGDLAVAMLRAAVLTDALPDSAASAVSRLMTWPSYSIESDSRSSLLNEDDELKQIQVNRTKVLGLKSPEEALGEIVPTTRLNLTRSPFFVRPHYVGQKMTPDAFRERGTALFRELESCLSQESHFSVHYLFPNFKTSDIGSFDIRYAENSIIDSVTQREVDAGVTLDSENPTILLNRKRVQDWAVDNYATDYLVFHEYAHAILARANRSDSDHMLAIRLFAECSRSSGRFRLDSAIRKGSL